MKTVSLLLAAFCAATALAQSEPQVHVAEVLRRGDLVTVMGEGPRSAPDQAFTSAMAPPADDSHCWYVTVWTTPGCAACEKLKADFRKSPELLAFVAAPAPSLPWAHYVEYSGADETQKDRRDKYKITRYPTIVVQPPRNKMWGDPGIVVFYDNSGYDSPKHLATKIQKAVRKFAEVQGKKGFPKTLVTVKEVKPDLRAEPVPLWQFTAADAGGAGQAIGVNPPFSTPAKPDPFNPNAVPAPNSAPVQFPPPDQSPTSPGLLQILSLVGTLFGWVMPSSSTLIVVILIAQFVLKLWDVRAKQTPAKWDDNAIAFVRSLIAQAQNPTQPASPPSGPSVTS